MNGTDRLSNAKLDELMALAEKMPAGTYGVQQSESWGEYELFTPITLNGQSLIDVNDAEYFAACNADTIRALVEEVKLLRESERAQDREIQRLRAENEEWKK